MEVRFTLVSESECVRDLTECNDKTVGHWHFMKIEQWKLPVFGGTSRRSSEKSKAEARVRAI